MTICGGAIIGLQELDHETALAAAIYPEEHTALNLPDAESIVRAGDVIETASSVRTWWHPQQVPLLPPDAIEDQALWLARCIYSETKRPVEQELVAWVVRNRVETGYRGADSYYEAILDPFQFSAFNPGNRKRLRYLRLNRFSQAPGWQRALAIADMVIHSDSERRPFATTTRHFFSKISMPGGRHPYWSYGHQNVAPDRDYSIDIDRFRFYAGVR